MKDTERTKAASLYIYSRASGRLILCEEDARFRLRLDSGGTMYSQGLTILIDDVEGRLPLNPTKQDVAFGEQANGEVHSENLFMWVRAVTRFFYDYHLAKFDKQRTRLTERLTEFGSEPVEMPLKEVDKSHFTTFTAKFHYYRNRIIVIDQKTAQEATGPDTHFHLVPPPPPLDSPPSKIVQISSSRDNSATVPETKRIKTDPRQLALNYQADMMDHQVQQTHNYGGVAEARSYHPQERTQYTGQQAALPGSYSMQQNPHHYFPHHSQQLDQIQPHGNNHHSQPLNDLNVLPPPQSQANYQQHGQQPWQVNGRVNHEFVEGTRPNQPQDQRVSTHPKHGNAVRQNLSPHSQRHLPQNSQRLDQGQLPNNHHPLSVSHHVHRPSNHVRQEHEPRHQQGVSQQQQHCSQRQNEVAQSIQTQYQNPSDSGGFSSPTTQRAHGKDPAPVSSNGGQGKLPAIIPNSRDAVPTELNEHCSTRQVKAERGAVAKEVINLADDDDENSLGGQSEHMVDGGPAQQPEGNSTNESGVNDDDDDSTGSSKEYYKDLCEKLVLKLERKNETDSETKKKMKGLRREIVELKKEVERQNLLLSQVTHS